MSDVIVVCMHDQILVLKKVYTNGNTLINHNKNERHKPIDFVYLVAVVKKYALFALYVTHKHIKAIEKQSMNI